MKTGWVPTLLVASLFSGCPVDGNGPTDAGPNEPPDPCVNTVVPDLVCDEVTTVWPGDVDDCNYEAFVASGCTRIQGNASFMAPFEDFARVTQVGGRLNVDQFAVAEDFQQLQSLETVGSLEIINLTGDVDGIALNLRSAGSITISGINSLEFIQFSSLQEVGTGNSEVAAFPGLFITANELLEQLAFPPTMRVGSSLQISQNILLSTAEIEDEVLGTLELPDADNIFICGNLEDAPCE